MRYDVIASGSKGNATIVVSEGKALLIDFGISKKRVREALSSYGLSMDDVVALFLTHGHDDHNKSAHEFDREKVYAPMSVYSKEKDVVKDGHLVTALSKFSVAPFEVLAVPMSHDFKNTMAYVVTDGKESLSLITDTGFIPERTIPYLKNSNYLLVESNHDPRMLYESSRPDYLIRRIISDKGHLSNYSAAGFLSLLVGDKTKEICLLHLSEECNTKDLAIRAYNTVMREQLGYIPDALLKVSSQDEETRGGER